MKSRRLPQGDHWRLRENRLTTNAIARLLTEIVAGQAVSAQPYPELLELLKRHPSPGSGEKNDQAHACTAPTLPPGSKLWSNARSTGECRHDATYLELPNGAKFVLVTCTMDHANEREFIPAVAKAVVEEFTARE